MSYASPDAHRRGREALQAAWLSVTGKEATLPELQIAAAQAHLESGYGQAAYKNLQTGETSILHNWGAVQAGAPPCGNNFEATDTHADGSHYQWCYKRYATDAEGAAHLVTHMTVKRPASWEHMKRGDIDAWARQMRQKDPISGQGLYFEQDPDKRAAGIEARIQEIAATFGEPMVAVRGGPGPGGGSMPGPGGGGGATTESVWRKPVLYGGGASALAGLIYALIRLLGGR